MSNASIPARFTYSQWRHGGWYVNEVRYPSGAIGCVSRNYPDGKWRIVCGNHDATFPTREAAARAEFEIAAAERAAAEAAKAAPPAAPVASDPVPADVPCYLAVSTVEGVDTVMGVFRVADHASPEAAEREASKLCDRIQAAAPLASYGTRWSAGKSADEPARSECPAERDMEDAARVKAESREAHGFTRGQAVRVRDGYEFGGATRTGEVVTQLHGSQPAWAVRCEFGGAVHYMRPDGIEAVTARAASPILQRLAEANAALDDCERRKRVASSDSVFQHTTLRSEWNRLFDARESLQAMAVQADPIAYVRAYPRHAMAYRHLLPADMVARIEAAEDDAAMRAAVGAPAMVPQPAQQQQGRDTRRGMARCDGPGLWQIGIWTVMKREIGWEARATGPGTIGDGSPQLYVTLAAAYRGLTGEPMPGARGEDAEPLRPMVAQPCQPQQGRARGRAIQPPRGERRYVTVRDTETGEMHRVLTSVARVGFAVVVFVPSNRHRQGALSGMLITHDDTRKAWVFNDEAEARHMLSRNRAPGERVIPAELVSDPAV